MTNPERGPNSDAAPSAMAHWCRAVIWADLAVLALAGLASIPGLFRMAGSVNWLAQLAGVLLLLKVAVGLVADSHLLAGRRLGMTLAYIAASVAIVGALYTLVFVDAGAGADARSWAYRNRSGLQVFLFGWSVAWNIVYVVAARAAQRSASPIAIPVSRS